MGYTVYASTFLDHVKKNFEEFKENKRNSVQKWLTNKVNDVRTCTQQCKTGKISVKGNIVFIHRSPLSADLHREIIFPGQENFGSEKMMLNLENEHIISVVYCWSDQIRQRERVGERNYWAKLLQQEQNVLDFFQEENEEIQSRILSAYDNANRAGKFVGNIPTTSSQQATAQLLTMCGLDFGKTVDVSKFS